RADPDVVVLLLPGHADDLAEPDLERFEGVVEEIAGIDDACRVGLAELDDAPDDHRRGLQNRLVDNDVGRKLRRSARVVGHIALLSPQTPTMLCTVVMSALSALL